MAASNPVSANDRRTRIDAALPTYRRERLRGPDEARFLRRIGTPDALIGPVGSDADVECERRELVEFARRLRSAAGRRPA